MWNNGAKGLTKKRVNKIYKLGPYRMSETQLISLGIKPEIINQLPEDTNPWAKPSKGIDLNLIHREMLLGIRRKELERLASKPKESHTKKDDQDCS